MPAGRTPGGSSEHRAQGRKCFRGQQGLTGFMGSNEALLSSDQLSWDSQDTEPSRSVPHNIR